MNNIEALKKGETGPLFVWAQERWWWSSAKILGEIRPLFARARERIGGHDGFESGETGPQFVWAQELCHGSQARRTSETSPLWEWAREHFRKLIGGDFSEKRPLFEWALELPDGERAGRSGEICPLFERALEHDEFAAHFHCVRQSCCLRGCVQCVYSVCFCVDGQFVTGMSFTGFRKTWPSAELFQLFLITMDPLFEWMLDTVDELVECWPMW